MSEQEFESYLRLLGRFLRLTEAQREAIGRELRGHMEDRLEELLGRGYTRDEAITTILDEFGDTAALASEFGRIGRRRKWIMRTTTGTIAAAVCILVVSFLMPEHRSIPAPAMTQAEEASSPVAVTQARTKMCVKHKPVIVAVPEESKADRLARERLDTIIPTVAFDQGTVFEDVLGFLREAGKTSVNVNWNTLEVLGIDRTTPSGGINLRNVKLETVLDILIANVGGRDADLAYDVYDGIVHISTAEELATRTITRVYDVRPLLDVPLSTRAQASIAILVDKIRLALSEGPRKEVIIQTERAVQHIMEELQEEDVEELQELIIHQVGPGTWVPDGIGSMDIWKDRMIVTHTPRAHREVLTLLQMLLEVDRPTTQPSE